MAQTVKVLWTNVFSVNNGVDFISTLAQHMLDVVLSALT